MGAGMTACHPLEEGDPVYNYIFKMKKYIFSFVIIFLAFFFRFNNLNWDENFHLHPDERFLTMVGTAMTLPHTVSQYFDQKTSLMNPTNIGFTFFVYGHFPTTLTKYLSVVYKMDNYNDFTILGRQLSAFFDLLTVLFIIKVVKLLEDKLKLSSSIKYWAGFFYAIAVLPIQLSHFFAVDTFLNFFMFGSFYFVLRKKNILSAIFFGLALSCKITALFILPLNLFFLLKTVFVQRHSLIKVVLRVFLYFIIAYLTLRLGDPYYFQNSSFFDPTLNKLFVENIKSLQNMTVKNLDNWFPPMVQWLSKNTIKHSLVNNIVFGLGIPYAILAIIGMAKIILNIKDQISKIHIKYQKVKNYIIIKQLDNFDLAVILFWTIAFFVYQSLQATPTLRYFIIIYPFLAIFASIGIDYLIHFKLKFKEKHLKYPKYFSYIFVFTSVLILLIWPAMFSSIYFHKHTRVEASEWIYKNLSNNSFILGEAWDDSLPLWVTSNFGKQFLNDQLRVFDPDTNEKWNIMNETLARADYYVLSSNRGWGSITTVPKKYPLMSKFYNDLLADKNFKYKKIKEFNSYPQIKFQVLSFKFQISFPDQWSDEGFTVYDHPKVLIYKNVKK